MNFLLFKLVLEKAEESEIKLPTSAGSQEHKAVWVQLTLILKQLSICVQVDRYREKKRERGSQFYGYLSKHTPSF